jgi:hypothetical protein
LIEAHNAQAPRADAADQAAAEKHPEANALHAVKTTP